MANFCTKCGASLDPGARFCVRCGTPAADAGAAAAPPPAGAAEPPPMMSAAPQPYAAPGAPPQQSTSAVKIILIVVGIFVGLGILAGAAVMFGVWSLARAVKTDPSGDKVSISTPMGSMTVGKTQVTEEELGIPIYPGAEPEQGSMRLGSAKGSMETFVFRTKDSPQRVIEFYRDKMGDKMEYLTTPQGGMITSAKSEKEGYMITVGKDDDKGDTVISVMRGISNEHQ
jgi:zinc ribbon protein